ncbi:hypothetical protein SCHPADRAFT_932493 [Schizopora paradoxa]|uniref:Uncharacterized protein n=1 Tax=Schizopora paradoxa TaxID=27342 RepID=A0A0H2RR88_9AGAM|nr:hypothetical protein SCHPADRAFT_932493 [Schizopora paradoxa]
MRRTQINGVLNKTKSVEFKVLCYRRWQTANRKNVHCYGPHTTPPGVYTSFLNNTGSEGARGGKMEVDEERKINEGNTSQKDGNETKVEKRAMRRVMREALTSTLRRIAPRNRDVWCASFTVVVGPMVDTFHFRWKIGGGERRVGEGNEEEKEEFARGV